MKGGYWGSYFGAGGFKGTGIQKNLYGTSVKEEQNAQHL
jgi:hypothetical protein